MKHRHMSLKARNQQLKPCMGPRVQPEICHITFILNWCRDYGNKVHFFLKYSLQLEISVDNFVFSIKIILNHQQLFLMKVQVKEVITFIKITFHHVVTSSTSRSQSFKCAHRGGVCVRTFIVMSVRVCL
jgi:hypothetical protein